VYLYTIHVLINV